MVKRLVVIGASAGGVQVLRTVVGRLPLDFAAPVVIVLHVAEGHVSLLPDILQRAGLLPVDFVHDGEPLRAGRIYVAPAGFHTVIERGCLRLHRGPRENRARPAIDTLFRTAARAYGRAVVAVLLSGALDDGTAGMVAVSRRGGINVVQLPADASVDAMPRSALAHAHVHHTVPAADIGGLLMRLVHEEIGTSPSTSDDIDVESAMAQMDPSVSARDDKYEGFGIPSEYSCPECNGVLWKVEDASLLRYRCRVGHAYSAQNLLAAQEDAVETALWEAFRALEESASVARRLADRMAAGAQELHRRYEQRASELEHHARILRRILAEGPGSTTLDKLNGGAPAACPRGWSRR